MSGGSKEQVAGYVNNGYESMETYGGSLVNAEGKYKNVYYSTTTSGVNTQEADYKYANPNYAGTYPEGYSKKYGDAVWETSSSALRTNSWYSDYSAFPGFQHSFFVRGGNYVYTTSVGVFGFIQTNGNVDAYSGFRVVVPVL